MLTEVKFLDFCKQAVVDDKVVFSDHAETESMVDDDVTREDVLHVLLNAIEAEHQNKEKWKVYGPIVDGDEYAVVVDVHEGREHGRVAFVVTTHYPP